MVESRQPVLQRIIQGCSSVLLIMGAAIFLLGGKFLYEIKHVSFLAAESVGIAGGIFLMLLGGGMMLSLKSSDPTSRASVPRPPEEVEALDLRIRARVKKHGGS